MYIGARHDYESASHAASGSFLPLRLSSHLPLLFLAFLSSSFPFTNTHEIFYSFGSLFAPLLPLSLFESSPKARNVVSAFLECVFPFFSEHGGRMGFRVSGPAIQLLFEKRLKFVNTL